MTCQELEGRLDGYVRGELSLGLETELEEHLRACPSCSRRVELAEPELTGVSALPGAVIPVEDLWPKIQDGIRTRQHRGRVLLPVWVLAAAAVLLIMASSGATTLLLREHVVPAVRPSSRVLALEAEYAAASRDLTVALEQARGRLSPKTFATIERNLAVIDEALAEARQALARDPGNLGLEQLVVTVWRQKVDLLQRATAIEGAS